MKSHLGQYLLFLAFVLFVMVTAPLIVSQIQKATEPSPLPKLSDAQKLELRTAQVELLQANQALQKTAEFQAAQAAQVKFMQAIQKAYKDVGADQAKFSL